jgi:hypothetical protein
MSLSDAFRDRNYAPGYVYIAGSLSGRLIKIGTTINIGPQQKRLRNLKYASLNDWMILYYVWVDEGGRIEHDARRRLRHYKSLRMYEKDGSWQKGRETLKCSFSMAYAALSNLLTGEQKNAENGNRAFV